MITAEQVRDAMRERGLSQGKLSELAKVSKPVISTWLNGVREPSDISKTRIAFALDLLEPGDADDKQVSAAIAPDPEPEEIPALNPPETDETDDAPAARPGRDDTDYLTDEDLAAQEIMDALGLTEEEDEPEPAAEPAPEPEPEPEPTVEIRAQSPAELIYELTRYAGFYLYKDRDERLCIAVPDGDLDLERFCDNLRALDGMLLANNIDARAHSVVVASLLRLYRQEEDQ